MQIIFEEILSRVKSLMGGDSVYAFAKKLGISQQTADCYINGKRKPSLDFIHRVCVVCNCSSDWLLGLPERGMSANVTGDHNAVALGNGTKATVSVPKDACSTCKYKRFAEAFTALQKPD